MGRLALPARLPPQIVAVEGLDGVGKSTVTRALAELTGGVDVTASVTRSMGSSRRVVMASESVSARLHYWLSFNYLSGMHALNCTRTNRTAIIDGYFFRTIVCHTVLGASLNWNAVLSEGVRPVRAVLLTVPEEVRTARLQARSSDTQGPAWHAELEARSSEVLAGYREFQLMELESLTSPNAVAQRILAADAAQSFRFTA
jgi:thymidylate kinase